MTLIVQGKQAVFHNKTYQIALGRSGYSVHKQEGDGTTPVGTYPLRYLYYRPDRFQSPPKTPLKTIALTPNDKWCDDPSSLLYNQFTQESLSCSHEKLWRDDEVYDLIIVIGYNDQPTVPFKGSAIFIHIARENYTPTEGCIAFLKTDLLDILEKITPQTQISILGEWGE